MTNEPIHPHLRRCYRAFVVLAVASHIVGAVAVGRVFWLWRHLADVSGVLDRPLFTLALIEIAISVALLRLFRAAETYAMLKGMKEDRR